MAGRRTIRTGGKGAGRRYSRAHVDRSRRQRGGRIRRLLFTAAAVVLVVVTVSFLVLRSDNNISVFENAVGTVFRPVQSAFTSATMWVKGFFTNWRDYDKLQGEYERIELENEHLNLRLSALEELEIENARLSTLLDVREDHASLDPVHAKVIGRDPGQWFDTFSINRGTAHGVTEGMAIVSQGGLVGYVYEAGLTYAKVMSIIDTRSALACLVQRTRDNGVMCGAVTADASEAQCRVHYLPNVNNIVPGDVIITSGTDSLYPKGLVIGEVIAVSQETSTDGSYVIVAPYVDFRHIEDVLVLRTVIESHEELPVVATPTPAPYLTPKPTDPPTNPDGSVISPDADGGAWQYPTIAPDATPEPADGATPAPTQIETLPEDNWAG
ncbi:MAG: rod shape-determining protein MreC [Christensenellales bacterium]|jgi:rod shape-determining protein MreC